MKDYMLGEKKSCFTAFFSPFPRGIMVSRKFKHGDKVYYVTCFGQRVEGIVADLGIAEKADEKLDEGQIRVWGYWRGNSFITFSEEPRVFLIKPKLTRNLPSWF